MDGEWKRNRWKGRIEFAAKVCLLVFLELANAFLALVWIFVLGREELFLNVFSRTHPALWVSYLLSGVTLLILGSAALLFLALGPGDPQEPFP